MTYLADLNRDYLINTVKVCKYLLRVLCNLDNNIFPSELSLNCCENEHHNKTLGIQLMVQFVTPN